MRCALVRLALVLSIFLPSAASARPSGEFVTLHGVVLDPSRAPIAGARVTAVAEGRPPSTTTTDQRGEFVIDLAAGDYSLTISARGFVETTRPLNAAASSLTPIEFVLELSTVQESVEVTAQGGYETGWITSATKTATALRDVPQSVTVVTRELIEDQLMQSIGDVVRYVPGIAAHQGENNRDDVVIRGNRSSADFFVNGVRDDVQYYRDLYNLERVEALKGPNALIFGRGGGGGVLNRVVKEPLFRAAHSFDVEAGSENHKRVTGDINRRIGDSAAFRVNAMFEDSGSFRNGVDLERAGINPTLTFAPRPGTKVTLGYEYLRDTRVADRGITSFEGRPADVDPSLFYGDPAQSDVRANVNIGTAAFEQSIGKAVLKNRLVVADYSRFYQNFVPGAASANGQTVALTAYNNASDRTNVFNQTDVTFRGETGALRHTVLAGAEVGRQVTDNFRNTGFFSGTTTSINVPFHAPTISTPVTFRQSATDADNHVRTSVAAAFVQDQIELTDHVQVLGGLRFDRFDLRYHNNRTGEIAQPRGSPCVSSRRGRLQAGDASVALRQLQRFLPAEQRRSVLVADGHHAAGETGALQQLRGRREVGCPSGAVADRRDLPPRPHEHAVHRSKRPDPHRADRQPAHEWRRARRQRANHARVARRGRLRLAGRVRHERDCGRTGRRRRRPGAAPHVLALEQLPAAPARGGRRRNHPAHGHVRHDLRHRDPARLRAGGCGGFRQAGARVSGCS